MGQSRHVAGIRKQEGEVKTVKLGGKEEVDILNIHF